MAAAPPRFMWIPLQNGSVLALSPDERTSISREIDWLAGHLVSTVQAIDWNKQARSIFENKADCRTVKERLMATLAQRNQE